MKKKEWQNLQNKPLKELKELLNSWTKEMLEMGLKLKTGKLKDVHAVGKKRKDVARIKTLLALKETAGQLADKKA